MLSIIKLEVEDINTRQIGHNFMIEVDPHNQIILSPEAAKVLYQDIEDYLKANEDIKVDEFNVEVKGSSSVVNIRPTLSPNRIIRENSDKRLSETETK